MSLSRLRALPLVPLLVVLSASLSASTPAQACATCACNDPALVGARGARPAEGRVRVGTELRYLSVDVAAPATTTRGLRLGILADATLVEGLAIDMFLPVIAARRESRDSAALDFSVGDSDLSLRWVFFGDRAFSARVLLGVRGGLVAPLSTLGRDVHGSRLDVGVWVPHTEVFGSMVRDAGFVAASLGLRSPLSEAVGAQSHQRGLSVNAAVRGQLQPRSDVGVFVSFAGELATPTTLDKEVVAKSGGSRLDLSSGIAFVGFEDALFELAAAVPLVQTQPEHLTAMLVLSATFDVGRR